MEQGERNDVNHLQNTNSLIHGTLYFTEANDPVDLAFAKQNDISTIPSCTVQVSPATTLEQDERNNVDHCQYPNSLNDGTFSFTDPVDIAMQNDIDITTPTEYSIHTDGGLQEPPNVTAVNMNTTIQQDSTPVGIPSRHFPPLNTSPTPDSTGTPDYDYDLNYLRVQINEAYEKVVYWQKNIFELPKGKNGKDFVNEMTTWIDRWSNKTKYREFAFKALFIMPNILLQRTSLKAKSHENKTCLERRLKTWKDLSIPSTFYQKGSKT